MLRVIYCVHFQLKKTVGRLLNKCVDTNGHSDEIVWNVRLPTRLYCTQPCFSSHSSYQLKWHTQMRFDMFEQDTRHKLWNWPNNQDWGQIMSREVIQFPLISGILADSFVEIWLQIEAHLYIPVKYIQIFILKKKVHISHRCDVYFIGSLNNC